MERNEKQPEIASSLLMKAEADWHLFADGVRALLTHFQERVANPITESWPEFDLPVQTKDIEKLLKIENFNVVLFGQVKSGKTMLLKALLGIDLPLPSSVTPCTSVKCTIRYGTEKVVFIEHRSDASKNITQILTDLKPAENDKRTEQQLMQDFLRPFIAQEVEERQSEFPWKSVEIYWPSPLLKSGLTFIDAPGFGENEFTDNMLQEAVANAHLLLVVLDGSHTITCDIILEIRRFQEMPKEMFFVATKFDRIEGEDDSPESLERAQILQIEYIKRRIQEFLPEFNGKLDNRFHAVAAREIIVRSQKPLEYEDRFRQLESSINDQIVSNIKGTAAALVLQNLSLLVNKTSNSVRRMKEDKKVNEESKQQWHIKLKKIEEEKKLVDQKLVKLTAATEVQIREFVSSLFSLEPDLVVSAQSLVESFHTTWKLKNEWKNSKDQKKNYSEDLKNYVSRHLPSVVNSYWSEQEKKILEILVDRSKQASQITSSLRAQISEFEQDLSSKTGNVNAELSAVRNAALSTDSTTFLDVVTFGPLSGGIIGGVGGGVVGAIIGGAALFGALIAGIPLALFTTFVMISNWRDEYDVEKATLNVRDQMQTKLREVVMEMKAPCVRQYSEMGRQSIKDLSTKIDAYISLAIVGIKSELKNLDLIKHAKLPNSFFDVLHEIDRTIDDYKELCRTNPFIKNTE
eukprot:TRINITY_DN3091_c0_g2_i1.p1 TRINITY_DN3091_c0_g2~~TRINITY_DN3091_c0_g2_i1.p1  ORF type:complete len:689 (+),score=83.75 TRINITY_DN3091_c0_g2_i1:132-2198(+)